MRINRWLLLALYCKTIHWALPPPTLQLKTTKFKIHMSSDMSDSFKWERLIHCPLFYWGFFISYGGSTNCKNLLSINSRDWFLKYQDVQCTCWVRFCITKLKMLARNYVGFDYTHPTTTLWQFIIDPLKMNYYYWFLFLSFVFWG